MKANITLQTNRADQSRSSWRHPRAEGTRSRALPSTLHRCLPAGETRGAGSKWMQERSKVNRATEPPAKTYRVLPAHDRLTAMVCTTE